MDPQTSFISTLFTSSALIIAAVVKLNEKRTRTCFTKEEKDIMPEAKKPKTEVEEPEVK